MIESIQLRRWCVGLVVGVVAVFGPGEARGGGEQEASSSEAASGESTSEEDDSDDYMTIEEAERRRKRGQEAEGDSDGYMTIEEAERQRNQGVDQIVLRGHFLGLQFDVGTRYAAGLGYSWGGSTRTFHRPGASSSRWWGVGPHLRTHTGDFETFDAFELGAHGRLVLASIWGIGLEAELGLAHTGRRLQGTGLAGVFWPLWHVLEVGYSYQVPFGPFERPDWLSSHQFSVRSNIPLHQRRTDEDAPDK